MLQPIELAIINIIQQLNNDNKTILPNKQTIRHFSYKIYLLQRLDVDLGFHYCWWNTITCDALREFINEHISEINDTTNIIDISTAVRDKCDLINNLIQYKPKTISDEYVWFKLLAELVFLNKNDTSVINFDMLQTKFDSEELQTAQNTLIDNGFTDVNNMYEQNDCPLDGDTTNECKDCPENVDYFFNRKTGQCDRRPEDPADENSYEKWFARNSK